MPARAGGSDAPWCVIASCVRPAAGNDARRAAKDRLVRGLLCGASEAASPEGNFPWDTGSFNEEIRLTADALGRPLLLLGDRRGPSVSFTHVGLKTWAALATRDYAIGIDAACGSEFIGDYPFHRAFQDGELDAARSELAVDVSNAAAAIWSAKEATVKALGCGFWLADPREVHVAEWRHARNRFFSRVTLSVRARHRFAFAGVHHVHVRTFSEHGVWVSAAVVDPAESLYTFSQVR